MWLTHRDIATLDIFLLNKAREDVTGVRISTNHILLDTISFIHVSYVAIIHSGVDSDVVCSAKKHVKTSMHGTDNKRFTTFSHKSTSMTARYKKKGEGKLGC